MSENMKLLLKFMKQYIDEPNVPDYSGEYPPCWEITQEDVKEILEYINSLQQENKQLIQSLNEQMKETNKENLNCSKYAIENTNLKQALNEIRNILDTCKKLMPHEFDWEEQADNILQIIDKYLGGSDEITK